MNIRKENKLMQKRHPKFDEIMERKERLELLKRRRQMQRDNTKENDSKASNNNNRMNSPSNSMGSGVIRDVGCNSSENSMASMG